MYRKIVSSTAVCRIADGAMIPEDAGNLDWLDYEAWLVEGNLPAEPIQPPFGPAKEAELAAFRANRELYLNRLSGIGMAAQFDDRADDLASVIKVRKGLLALTTLPGVVDAASLDELKAAMKQAYAALLVGVPAEVKAAFKGVDA